ncbi:cytochrome C [Crenobacter cavernae]|uniref:Cytochrome C n=2 Tax=Crenobacter cavernae TaxID=2290923 RepID=A0A345Y3D8_9NEIS|nr:cytochrome C [Crenobacter cavernae]
MGVVAVVIGVCAPAVWAAKHDNTALKSVERGRYLVKITGCNDCHTPGFAMSGGQVAEKQWLIGDSLGWRGPWGTTYPSNLRRYVQGVSEGDWLKVARTAELRPPMPVPSLRAMSDADLKAIYRYIRYLGPAGSTAPAYQPPGEEPKGPVVLFPSPPQ